jgi:peptide/nickel transport system permease protein
VVSYVVRRLIAVVLLLLALSIVTFLIFSAVPTDPAALTCGKSCSPQIIAANRIKLGLDKSLVEQYWLFLKGIFDGRWYGSGTARFHCDAPCLGYSFRRGETVLSLILHAFPVTLALSIGAFVVWMIGGVLSGIFAALRRGKWQDRVVMGIALVGYSLPAFFIGLVLIFVFVVKLKWLPFTQWVPLHDDPVKWFQNLILPWITLALLYAAFYARLTRNQMLETLGEDYIRTARAKGLPERVVIGKHAFRAGLTPLVTAAGLDFAALLGGVGRLAVKSVVDLDLPIIIGVTLFTGFFVVIANLVVDLLYAAIDPRVRIA